MTLRGKVYGSVTKASVRRHAPYLAYIAPARLGWKLPDPAHPETIRLGRLDVDWNPKSYIAKGSIDIRVPDVARGRYLVAFCNRPCTKRFGDVYQTDSFRVVPTSLEARTRERVLRMEWAIESVNRRVVREHRDRRRTDRKMLQQIDNLSERVSSLTIALARTGNQKSSGGPPLGLYAVGAALGLLTLIIHRRRRSTDMVEQELDRLVDLERSRSQDTRAGV